jgi:cation transport regulator ChaB
METRITVNGVEYKSVDDMPPDVRSQYERAMQMLADKDGNGVPDILEGKSPPVPGGATKPVSVVTHTSRIVLNGKQYKSWDDVPRQVRALLNQPEGATVRIERDRRHQPRITLQLSGATVLALLAALLVVGAIIWLTRG